MLSRASTKEFEIFADSFFIVPISEKTNGKYSDETFTESVIIPSLDKSSSKLC